MLQQVKSFIYKPDDEHSVHRKHTHTHYINNIKGKEMIITVISVPMTYMTCGYSIR